MPQGDHVAELVLFPVQVVASSSRRKLGCFRADMCYPLEHLFQAGLRGVPERVLITEQ